jgi:hypothetical protein
MGRSTRRAGNHVSAVWWLRIEKEDTPQSPGEQLGIFRHTEKEGETPPKPET